MASIERAASLTTSVAMCSQMAIRGKAFKCSSRSICLTVKYLRLEISSFKFKVYSSLKKESLSRDVNLKFAKFQQE